MSETNSLSDVEVEEESADVVIQKSIETAKAVISKDQDSERAAIALLKKKVSMCVCM